MKPLIEHNSECRQELLKEIEFDNERCAKRRGDPEGPRIRWKLAASFKPAQDKPTLEFGRSENGNWVVLGGDGSVRDVDDDRDYLPFYPLLEMTLVRVRTVVADEFRRHGISVEWLTEFPFPQIAASALRSGSKFWPDDALQWVDQLLPCNELEDALRFLQEEGRTQSQRHRAAKLLRSSAADPLYSDGENKLPGETDGANR